MPPDPSSLSPGELKGLLKFGNHFRSLGAKHFNALHKVGTKITERWLYRRGTQSLPMLVTIIDGKIQSIERAE